MNLTTSTRMTQAISPEHRHRLMHFAHEVNIPMDTRLFDEGGRADRFWIIRSGSVALDMHVPGRRSPVIETLGPGELVGWSWLFPPCTWQLGAAATTPVRAHEFDAATVRQACEQDPVFGKAVGQWVGKVLAHRLQCTRTRILDLYAPYGSGSTR
ncbi:cyclic nucleotide-binding domain-containing protein [Streptomyces sp. KL118A]|uniref:cyclic nucleotide-binding domain-containing protein n=1 Tax=Streptomyces sp. KL118A TaxID=3045153 RepID=UPI00278BF0A9|nr:cyclic nucleotide-binding domain-containing protein [Streptomyces sp. KL118A]